MKLTLPKAPPARRIRRWSAETRPAALQEIIEIACAKGLAASGKGAPSTQIPGLDSVEPESFAFSVALLDGTIISSGQSTTPFSLQSITKLFSLTALLELEPDVWGEIGWEPTDASFRSLTELEAREGRPRNPFVNAGALVVTDKLHTLTGNGLQPTLELIRRESGNSSIKSVSKIARAEWEHANLNTAIAHLLNEHGRLKNPIPAVLRSYFRQCAIAASTDDIARSALFLARRDHTDCERTLSPETRRRVNAVLLTAGMYSAAGDIAYRVGIPVKSGIGGGIVGVLPGVGTVSVWSPPLDEKGNSLGGIAALEEFSKQSGWSLF